MGYCQELCSAVSSSADEFLAVGGVLVYVTTVPRDAGHLLRASPGKGDDETKNCRPEGGASGC